MGKHTREQLKVTPFSPNYVSCRTGIQGLLISSPKCGWAPNCLSYLAQVCQPLPELWFQIFHLGSWKRISFVALWLLTPPAWVLRLLRLSPSHSGSWGRDISLVLFLWPFDFFGSAWLFRKTPFHIFVSRVHGCCPEWAYGPHGCAHFSFLGLETQLSLSPATFPSSVLEPFHFPYPWYFWIKMI